VNTYIGWLFSGACKAVRDYQIPFFSAVTRGGQTALGHLAILLECNHPEYQWDGSRSSPPGSCWLPTAPVCSGRLERRIAPTASTVPAARIQPLVPSIELDNSLTVSLDRAVASSRYPFIHLPTNC
jgi:hypothetical protein